MSINLKKEASAVPITIFLMIGSYLISYLLKIYLARHLGSEFYGEYVLAFQVLTFVSFIALLGTNAAGTRFLAKFLHQHKDSDTLSFVTWNIKFIRRAFISCWAIGIIAFVIMLILHHSGVRHIDKYHLVIYMFWVAPLSASIALLCSYLMANNNFILSTFLQGTALNSIFFIYFIIAFKLWPNDISNSKIVGVLCAGTITIAFFCLNFVIRKIESLKNLDLKDVLLGKIKQNPQWLHASMKLVVSQMAYFLLTICVFFILQFILKSHSKVAYFSAGLTIASFLYIIGMAICIPIKPLISSLSDSNAGRKKLQRKINNANLMLVFILVPLTLLTLLFSTQLLNHFGPGFAAARTTCIILVIGSFLHCFSLIGQMLLAYAGYSKELMWIKLTGLITTIITGIIGTLWLGMVGMAYAYLLYVLVVQVPVTISCYRKIKLKTLTLI